MAARQLVNLLRGSVDLEVTGAFPERFLNLCAQEGRAFWGVAWPDSHTLRLTVAWPDRAGLEDLAERTGCRIAEGSRHGLPPFFLRFRRRYALLVSLALVLAVFGVLSRFVLVVEVEGNERVPTQVILTELYRQGLRPGVYGPGLAEREVADKALLQLPQLSWMAVNLHGIRAQVVVREKVEKPELVDETVLGDIVAEAPGIVTHMEVWSGDPAVEEGDTVLPGDVLIRGSVRMDPPQYSENPPEWMAVRAMGKVEGRTWRTLTAVLPLEAQVKAYSGDEKTAWSVTILGQRVNFSQNSGILFDRYDKITHVWNCALPGGRKLPISLSRETWREYDTVSCSVDLQAAQTMVEEALRTQLSRLLGETGEMVEETFTAQVENGQLQVTLVAECREELGKFIPAESVSEG